VPWREGSAVRTARRSDLLKILVPFSARPALEPQFCHVRLFARAMANGNPQPPQLHVHARMYIVPATVPTSISFHHSFCRVRNPTTGSLLAELPVVLKPSDNRMSRVNAKKSLSLEQSTHELVVNGPGMAEMDAHIELESHQVENLAVLEKLDVEFSLGVAGGASATLGVNVVHMPGWAGAYKNWAKGT
jgi:hypothetical protein